MGFEIEEVAKVKSGAVAACDLSSKHAGVRPVAEEYGPAAE
jgi:hypothetical protein